MDNSIIVALIPAIASIIVMIISVRGSNKKTQETLTANHNATITELKNTNTLITMRMDSMAEEIKGLRTKVESHNQYDRRIVALETKGDMMERILQKLTDDGK